MLRFKKKKHNVSKNKKEKPFKFPIYKCDECGNMLEVEKSLMKPGTGQGPITITAETAVWGYLQQ